MQTILYTPETSEKQPTKPIEILHAILLLSANGQNATNRIIINPIMTIAILTFFIMTPPYRYRFVPLIEYHNHKHISIKFPLNFFFPPFRSALLPVRLSALVLKLPFKVLFIVADYLGIR